MLKGIPAIIPPELLCLLSEMGHGDELTIGDANFPAHTCCERVVRMDGHSVPEILDAVLNLIRWKRRSGIHTAKSSKNTTTAKIPSKTSSALLFTIV